MLLIRSVAFNVFFYLNITLWMIVAAPLLLAPKAALWQVIFAWSRLNLLALRRLAGIEVELRGLEHLPKTPVILAGKHQSAFETIALLHLFQRPAFILKKELMSIPLFGWFAAKVEMIPIDRKSGQRAIDNMLVSARSVVADDRQIIIFPEGTRRIPGAKPAYKYGITHLYRELSIPIVPVALNSGLFWPRSGFLRFPGKIVVEFLPVIEVGLDGDTVFSRLTGAIERASDLLLLEAVKAVPHPPLSTETRSRVAEITQR